MTVFKLGVGDKLSAEALAVLLAAEKYVQADADMEKHEQKMVSLIPARSPARGLVAWNKAVVAASARREHVEAATRELHKAVVDWQNSRGKNTDGNHSR